MKRANGLPQPFFNQLPATGFSPFGRHLRQFNDLEIRLRCFDNPDDRRSVAINDRHA
jgi:hypothetical protein